MPISAEGDSVLSYTHVHIINEAVASVYISSRPSTEKSYSSIIFFYIFDCTVYSMRHSCKGVGLEWEWSYCTLRYTVYTCCTRRTDKVRNRPSVVRVKGTFGNLDHGGTSERALVRRSYRRITLNRRPVMLVQIITQHRCLTQCFILINAHHCIYSLSLTQSLANH